MWIANLLVITVKWCMCPLQASTYCYALTSLRYSLNSNSTLNSNSQGQYAPRSHGYVRHLDAEGLDDRRVTLMVYLNSPTWSTTVDGGQLRLWEPSPATSSKIVDIPAVGNGSVLVFLSAAIPHQVQPSRSTKPRLAVAAWCY